MNSTQNTIQQQLTHSKSNLKINLIKYYDATKSDIDIAAQELLCNVNNIDIIGKNAQSPSQNDPIKRREKILDINKNLINFVEIMFENNIKEIDKYFANIEKEHTNNNNNNINREDINMKSLTCYCIFISRDKLKDEFKRLVMLGILIITDWYLDENQINFLR
jgi:hypothetical protein